MKKNIGTILFSGSIVFLLLSCSGSKGVANPVVPPDTSRAVTGPAVSWWVTSGDQQSLLQLQSNTPVFRAANPNGYTTIEVDSMQTFQQVDGFGYTLTGGSAQLLNTGLFQQMFPLGRCLFVLIY
jgi:glucosylceramidase